MQYKYDAFVSYSQHDRPWAQKLFETLTAKGFRVFYDKERLDVGRQWDDQLRTALHESRSLVVVWTDDYAGRSDWVSRERSAFWLLPDHGQARLHISLNLQGRPQADTRMQSVEELIAAGAGLDWEDISSLQEPLWNKALDRVVRSLSTGLVLMPLVLLTLTSTEANNLPANVWDEIDAQLGLNKERSVSVYGNTREDWKPLGGQLTIKEMLTRLEERINRKLAKPDSVRYVWEPAPAAFWTDMDVAANVADSLVTSNAPALVVIDPIALRSIEVLNRLFLFRDCIEQNRMAIMVLPPFEMAVPSQRLRKWLMDHARSYFQLFFQPALPPRPRIEAQCNFYSADEDEIVRLLFSTVGRCVSSVDEKNRPAYLMA
jgi:hypothetical protein